MRLFVYTMAVLTVLVVTVNGLPAASNTLRLNAPENFSCCKHANRVEKF
jgi:hypothetical protein